MSKIKLAIGAALIALLVILLSSCGDGHFRYSCQDPANWEKTECKPPVCSANGACPIDLVGKDVFEGTTNG
jgi:hypothetical protein